MVKSNQRKDKIQKPQMVSHIVVSLEYLTTNKSYNFDYFAKEFRKSQEAYSSLFSLISDMCKTDISNLRKTGKIRGGEIMEYEMFSHSMQHTLKGTGIQDYLARFIVFRFCSQKYRMICKPDPIHSNLLYVLAFDFDFSAYNHE